MAASPEFEELDIAAKKTSSCNAFYIHGDGRVSPKIPKFDKEPKDEVDRRKLAKELRDEMRTTAAPTGIAPAAEEDTKTPPTGLFFVDLEGHRHQDVPKFWVSEAGENKLLNWLRKEQRRKESLRLKLVELMYCGDTAHKRELADMKKDNNKLKKEAKERENHCQFLESQLKKEKQKTVTAAIKFLQGQIKELEKKLEKGRKECKICLKEEARIMFHCGHSACRSCADRLQKCHVCRRDLRNFINIYSP